MSITWLRSGRQRVKQNNHQLQAADSRSDSEGIMEVTITTFFTALQKDVDNVVKPILDGLKQVIYADDGEIYKLTSQRVDQKVSPKVDDASTLLAEVIIRYSELVHILLIWEASEEN